MSKSPLNHIYSSALGCNGAYPHAYAKYIKENEGEQPHELWYPYKAAQGSCYAQGEDMFFHAGAKVHGTQKTIRLPTDCIDRLIL